MNHPSYPCLLAQFQAAPHETVGLWLAILGGLVGILWMMIQIWDKIRPRDPVPPLYETFATKTEVEAMHDGLSTAISELSDRLESTRQEFHTEVSALMRQNLDAQTKIHDRINEILRVASEIKGRCESIHGE